MLLGNMIIFDTMITFLVVPKKGEPTMKGAGRFLLVYGLSRYKCPSQGLCWFVFFPESISNKKSRKRDARRMENPKKSCLNRLAQLCGLAQFCGLSKRLSTIFLLNKKHEKHTLTLEMGTYHWDGNRGCFRGIYNVRCQVLFCGVCIHRRVGQTNKTKK